MSVAKYYVTFPLDGISSGKTIISATLTLHQFGNAGGSEAQPSWIQLLIASGDYWQEATITWNNAPLAYENIGGQWVDPLITFPGWPGVPCTWDISYAVARAYARGEPLRLIIYTIAASILSLRIRAIGTRPGDPAWMWCGGIESI